MPRRPYLITFLTRNAARKRVLEWIFQEWEKYADARNDANEGRETFDKHMLEEGVGSESVWFNTIAMYMHRAHLFGLETPQGRQAMMKAAATMVDCAASMVRVYGDPPTPGYPSGEIHVPEVGSPIA